LNEVPDASHPPTNEPVIVGRVRPSGKSRHGAPYPENAVEDTSVVDPWLVRQKRPNGGPLKVREFIPHDSTLRFGSLNHGYSEVCDVQLARPR
jgi:hypothetical protein